MRILSKEAKFLWNNKFKKIANDMSVFRLVDAVE